MATYDFSILRIIAEIASIGNGQIAITPTIDSVAGVKVFGYKDADGNSRRCAVLDANAQFADLHITGNLTVDGDVPAGTLNSALAASEAAGDDPPLDTDASTIGLKVGSTLAGSSQYTQQIYRDEPTVLASIDYAPLDTKYIAALGGYIYDVRDGYLNKKRASDFALVARRAIDVDDGIAASGTTIFCVKSSIATVYRIDADTLLDIDSYVLTETDLLWGIIYADDDYLYIRSALVSAMGVNIYQHDGTYEDQASTAGTDYRLAGIASNATHVFVNHSLNDEVYSFLKSTWALDATLTGVNDPAGMVVDNGYLWVGGNSSGRITKCEVDLSSVLDTWTNLAGIGTGFYGLASNGMLCAASAEDQVIMLFPGFASVKNIGVIDWDIDGSKLQEAGYTFSLSDIPRNSEGVATNAADIATNTSDIAAIGDGLNAERIWEFDIDEIEETQSVTYPASRTKPTSRRKLNATSKLNDILQANDLTDSVTWANSATVTGAASEVIADTSSGVHYRGQTITTVNGESRVYSAEYYMGDRDFARLTINEAALRYMYVEFSTLTAGTVLLVDDYRISRTWDGWCRVEAQTDSVGGTSAEMRHYPAVSLTNAGFAGDNTTPNIYVRNSHSYPGKIGDYQFADTTTSAIPSTLFYQWNVDRELRKQNGLWQLSTATDQYDGWEPRQLATEYLDGNDEDGSQIFRQFFGAKVDTDVIVSGPVTIVDSSLRIKDTTPTPDQYFTVQGYGANSTGHGYLGEEDDATSNIIANLSATGWTIASGWVRYKK